MGPTALMNVPSALYFLFDMRLLGLFWIFVYGVGVITVRHVVVFLETGDRRQRAVPIICAVSFALLVLMIYQGPALLAQWSLGPPGFSHAALFALWMGFLCTLWAAMDGVFVLYAARIHELLAMRLSDGGLVNISRQRPARRGVMIAALFGGFFTAYLVYFGGAVSTSLRQGWDGGDLLTLTFFYARLCYVFWISFEACLAVLAFRLWRLLRQAASTGR